MLHKNISLLVFWYLLCQCGDRSIKEMSQKDYPMYENDDLGLTRKNDTWTLKIYSPVSDSVKVNFYTQGQGGDGKSYNLIRGTRGTWFYSSDQISGLFYAFQTKINGKWSREFPDPYVKMVGINGNRGYVGLPSDHFPEGWENDTSPQSSGISGSIIYELQVRDFSIDPSSGMANKGKYSAFTERGTKYKNVSTGLDHLEELGITHVHLMPAFDFSSIDERDSLSSYNWGYEPYNYNVPEGSFSSDPYDPGVRVKEFKSMVQALHEKGIRVILDVVYNHTSDAGFHPFELSVPGYYYRKKKDGTFSNASACGNETASEKPMMRKFMLESMRYWMDEYHLDGFRVDLMGVHDIETMNLISRELKKIDPKILIYGEGWKAGPSTLEDSMLALKRNTKKIHDIAVFSDELRDGLKGHYAEKRDKGFVSGNESYVESVKYGLVGAIRHPGVIMDSVNYTNIAWSDSPDKMIAYASCHDDLTLWDKLKVANPDATEDELIKMHLLANTAVLLSQGISFLHGGADFLRTKYGDHNSFESPDSVNSIKWNQKEKFLEVFEYYRDLIRLKREHPAFSMSSSEQVKKHLTFLDINKNLIGYELAPNANGDDWDRIRVYLNGSDTEVEIDLPEGNWSQIIEGKKILTSGKPSGKRINIPAFSAQILYQ